MVHKPEHKVHSFRGLLTDGGQDEINLERQNLNLAYRIVKFQCMQDGFGNSEMVVKIYREKQTSIDSSIDFNQTDLLGACMLSGSSGGEAYPEDTTVIFDNTLFSRNIFVTAGASSSADPTNYYIEIEEVPVGPATLMQLKLGVARKLSLTQ